LIILKYLKTNRKLCTKRNNSIIKKILKVDYLRGRTKEYYANFIPAKKPKIEFSLFHPTVISRLTDDISPEFQGRIYGTPRQSLTELFD
jgi:hypothetical protein